MINTSLRQQLTAQNIWRGGSVLLFDRGPIGAFKDLGNIDMMDQQFTPTVDDFKTARYSGHLELESREITYLEQPVVFKSNTPDIDVLDLALLGSGAANFAQAATPVTAETYTYVDAMANLWIKLANYQTGSTLTTITATTGAGSPRALVIGDDYEYDPDFGAIKINPLGGQAVLNNDVLSLAYTPTAIATQEVRTQANGAFALGAARICMVLPITPRRPQEQLWERYIPACILARDGNMQLDATKPMEAQFKLTPTLSNASTTYPFGYLRQIKGSVTRI